MSGPLQETRAIESRGQCQASTGVGEERRSSSSSIERQFCTHVAWPLRAPCLHPWSLRTRARVQPVEGGSPTGHGPRRATCMADRAGPCHCQRDQCPERSQGGACTQATGEMARAPAGTGVWGRRSGSPDRTAAHAVSGAWPAGALDRLLIEHEQYSLPLVKPRR